MPLGFIAPTRLPAAEPPSWRVDIRPLLSRHCVDCHSGEAAEAGLDLEALGSDLGDAATFRRWVEVYDRVRAGEMPPADMPRPSKDDVLRITTDLERALHEADLARQQSEGRSVVRRLNRTQLENTLRDLLALPHLKVREMLPEDGSAAGFTTVGEALDVSSVHMARYMEAAQHALDVAIVHHPRPETVHRRLLYQDQTNLINPPFYPFWATEDEAIIFGRETGVFKANLTKFPAPFAGDYRIRASIRGYQTDELLPMVVVAGQGVRRSFLTDTHLLGYFDAPPGEPTVIDFVARLEREDRLRMYPPTLRMRRFPRKNAEEAKANYKGPGLAIQWVEVEGPLIEQWPPESHRRLFGDLPLVAPPPDEPVVQLDKKGRPRKAKNRRDKDKRDKNKREKSQRKRSKRDEPALVIQSENPVRDAERLLRDFLPRAFRRPVTESEIALYLGLVRSWLDRDASFEEAMRVGYTAVLCSPEFLLLHEEPGPLDGFALASRLSYFLWNSMPDDELFRLAEQGELQKPDVLRGQVERMLADPRAERFITDFVAQWLDLNEIDATAPDGVLYPEFDQLLQDSMVAETERFIAELLERDLSVKHLVTSDFAMLNGRLAEHYGIAGIEGVKVRRVPLPPGSIRGGVLTQASVLKVTANGTTTSPVPRGVWVLENILGTPPDPPPPNVPAIEPDLRGATTIREQLAAHRKLGACASCHCRIDPLGFGLECFDVIGGYRERYRVLEAADPMPTGRRDVSYQPGPPVEFGDVLPDGRRFDSIEEFKALLADEDQLARCVAKKLLTYSTGATETFADRRALDEIVRRAAEDGYGMRTLLHEVVQSPLFRQK